MSRCSLLDCVMCFLREHVAYASVADASVPGPAIAALYG
jgi:hypothetical protein